MAKKNVHQKIRKDSRRYLKMSIRPGLILPTQGPPWASANDCFCEDTCVFCAPDPLKKRQATIASLSAQCQCSWLQEAALGPRTLGNQSRRFPPSEETNLRRGSRGTFPPGRRPKAEKGRQRVFERWKGTQSPLQGSGSPRLRGLSGSFFHPIELHKKRCFRR